MKLAKMDRWTDDLPVCMKSGVGFQTNQRYRPGGGRGEFHDLEDVSFNFRHPNSNVGVYAVFDGHEGSAVSNYAAQRVSAELLLDKDLEVFSQDDMEEALRNAYNGVERGFFETIDELLVKRANLQIQIPEGLTFYQASQKYPALINRLQELDVEIQGGTSALVAIVQNDYLYVANVGDSRALLCTKDKKGGYHAHQLTDDHTVHNENELQRLANIGLDIVALQTSNGIANLETTRSLGDFRVKGGYKEYETLRSATSEPVISEPYISERVRVDDSFYFLALFTRGFYKTVEELSGPDEANRMIVSRIVCEISDQSTAEAVAQNVVNKVCREHQDQYNESNGKICKEREDMTLLVRLFSANLRKKSTPITPPISVSVGTAVRSGGRKSPGVIPVSIPFDKSVEPSDAHSKPVLIIPARTPPQNNQSFSQPSSRVSTPVTLMRTAATPPVAFYRNLSQLSERSKTSTPTSPTNSTSTTSSLTTQSPAFDTSAPSPRSVSPWAETVTAKANVPLTVDVGENQIPGIDGINDALAIAEKSLDTLKLDPICDDEAGRVEAERSQQEVQLEHTAEAPLDENKVEPYIDFSEFIRRVNEAGGEAVVFEEFIHR